MRASFDFHELTIIVVNENDPTSLYDLHVRVLNCDTISQVSFCTIYISCYWKMLQVKERILDLKYRGVPFSERPLANEIDLELVFFSNNYFCIYTFNLAANFNTSFSSAGPGW